MQKKMLLILINYVIYYLIFLNEIKCQSDFMKYGPGFGPLDLNNPSVDNRNFVNNNFKIDDYFASDPRKPKPAYVPIAYEHSDIRCRENLQLNQFEEDISVVLPYGKVHGKISYFCDHPLLSIREKPSLSRNNKKKNFKTDLYDNIPRIQGNISIFLGIPYAQPPTRENELRFKPPKLPFYQGAIDGSKYKPACPQARKYTGESKMIPEIDEDCLYLNIFTPFASNQIKVPYTVMVYIHGGSFSHGTGNTFPGYMLSLYQEVVVVTFNYRLGLFGFFATGDQHSPGNYGILDQIMLLNWVKNNIRKFNGDPDNIVLFGPEAGAISAGILAISPLSRKLVKRVIAQSGSAMADWAVESDYFKIKNNSIVVARTYGCLETDSEQIVRCLNSKSYNIVLNEVENEVGWLPFLPVLDENTRKNFDQVLPKLPELLVGQDKNLEGYLTGLTRDEGIVKVLEDTELIKLNFDINQDTFRSKIQKYLQIFNETYNEKAVLDALEFFYSPWTDRKNSTLWRKGLIELYSDSWFVAGVDKALKIMIDNHIKSYMYVLNYTLEGLNIPKWYGVAHNTEYLLVSGAPFMDYRFYPAELNLNNAEWSEADRNISIFFMQSWANFAKFNNPTPNSILNFFLWKPITRLNSEYLSVNSTNQTNIMLFEYKQKQSQFWNDYIHKLVGYRPAIWPVLFEPVYEEIRIYRTFLWAISTLLIILTIISFLCGCLYCRAISDREGDANIGFTDFIASNNQYIAPSSKANSEIDLNRSTFSTNIKEPINVNNGMRFTPTKISYNKYTRVGNVNLNL